MLRIFVDQDFDHDILRGLRLRLDLAPLSNSQVLHPDRESTLPSSLSNSSG